MTQEKVGGQEVVVEVAGVGKDFVLRHTRSLKEALVWLAKGRRGDLSAKFKALDDVNIEICNGETVALMGLNGSGSRRR